MVLSTIHVSQAHIHEKQSRCRTMDFPGLLRVEWISEILPSGFFFYCFLADRLFVGKDAAEVDFVIEKAVRRFLGTKAKNVRVKVVRA